MTTLTINITKDVLQRSSNCLNFISENCAIALAIKDIFKTVLVSSTTIYYCNPNESFSELPLEARRFILEFDNAKSEQRIKMEPFSFDIEVPDEVINGICIKEDLETIFNNHPTMELKKVLCHQG